MESNGNPDRSQVQEGQPFYAVPQFSITSPIFLVSSNNGNPSTSGQGRATSSTSNIPSIVNIKPSNKSLADQGLEPQTSFQGQKHKTIYPNLPAYHGSILSPLPIKPTPIKPAPPARKAPGKRATPSKSKQPAKQRVYTKVSMPELPPPLNATIYPNVTVVAKSRSRKRKAENKDSSCQTSGWKFMSEIGTIEAMREKNKNRDNQTSKSTIVASLRSICRKFKEKVELMNYDLHDNLGSVMDSVVDECSRWLKQHTNKANTCLLCEQRFLSEKALKYHFVSSCAVMRSIFVENVVGISQSNHLDSELVRTDSIKDKTVSPATVQDLFSKNYFHSNNVNALKGVCMFCGEDVKVRETASTDMYLDKRHFFDSCIVFKSFLVFHNQPYILATSQKVGTSWTFLYYYCLLNYYAMNFEHDLNDLRFIQEDKAHLILINMDNVTDNIIQRAAECPLCYSAIKNLAVLRHHIAFALCPFLLKFYQDMKVHVQKVWKTPAQVDHLRRITICFQSFMQFQKSPKPIVLKQSILNEALAYKLLENAMYFKSLDNNFTLQFYKSPKDAAVAMKIEGLQQTWAEEVLKGREDSTECPFCFTVFNTEKNLLKHLVYISCKSIRPLCNQIYNLIEYCEWDVLEPLNIVTQHSCYIIKQAILRGKYEINLVKDHLSEYVTIVIEKFLNLDLTEKVRNVMFEGTECESLQLKEELTLEEGSIFQEFYTWAKKVIKKKNVSVCPLCGQDESEVISTTLLNHLALGACPYLKQFLCLMDEVYKFNHLFRPCPAPTKIVINNNRSVSFDFVHHIRKVLFLFKASTKSKSKTFFDHAEFEDFLVNSPQNYIKHSNLMSFVIGNETSTCSFCFMDLKSQDHLLLHLLFFKCPSIMFVIGLVSNEWQKCSTGSMGKTDKMLDIIKVYSSIFELDPRAVISSSNMKKYFNENNNVAMLNNFKHLKAWAQEMFTFDANSNLNICNACNVAAELIERHLWFEEPVENFCPELKSYLDFHRKMVCKKDNRGEIQASFTVTDLFELKRFIQCQYSHMYSKSAMLDVEKQGILSPALKNEVKESINMTLKIYPRYDGTLESFKLMYGTSPVFLANQISIADKIAVSKICLLCDVMMQTVEDVRYHIATFECRVLQNMLYHAKSADQIDKEIIKNELINAYKRTVAFCREQYPNLNEGNLLLVTETVDPQCHSKLYNFILSKIPRVNPYKCLFCFDSFNSKGEIYTHYKKIQCLGLRECFGFIPNKGPVGIKHMHPFLQVVYDIFLNCYTMNSIRSICKLQKTLVGVNNLADMYEFWCSNFCDSFVPECPFCGQGLISVPVIKSHPMTCSKLREINLEVFRSDRLQDSTFMKQQGLGSCKLTGELPREIAKESEGVPFMQRYRCSQYLNWIPLCLDCTTTTNTNSEGSHVVDEETCRFLLFRRLIKKDNRLLVFDFESCQTIANFASWVPSKNSVTDLEVESAKYILRHCLPHFNQLMTTELWELENVANIRMKHQVKNVRELCDTCNTTLFNIHLFCPRCGYVICMDCYRDRLAGYVSSGLVDCSDGSAHNLTALETCVTIPPRAVRQLCSSVEAIKDLHCISVTSLPFTICPSDEIPHELICNGQVLALKEGQNPRNTGMFQKFHQKGNAIVVYGLQENLNSNLWGPESFSKHFGHERELVVNTTTLEVHRISLKDFFDGFENVNERPRNENGDPMILKLKDWPTTWDFKEKLPQWYDDFMKVLPMKNYTHRDGLYNIARYLPNIYCTPDLGPKMYIAYSNANNPNEGSTVLHIDISDAVNVVMYVGMSQDVVIKYEDDVVSAKNESSYLKRKVYTLKDICEDTDEKQLERIRRDRCKLGALWHIYHPNDIDKIRHFIHKVLNENGQTLPSGHDPIHDQAMYLDKHMRIRLFQEYGVKGWPIAQCEGDAVIIPAGAPHQVRNLQSCIKIAEDFVSPERVSFCLKHTQEIRHLSKNHMNQEDKLQIKNLLYHGVKECVSLLQNHIPSKDLCTCTPSCTTSIGTQVASPPAQDSRDLAIERLQAELDALKKSGAAEKQAFKELLDSQQVDYIKAKRYYEVEKQENGSLKSKISKLLKHHNTPQQQQRLNSQSTAQQQSVPIVKVMAMPYPPAIEGRAQQTESHIQELRKPEARHPQLRTSDARHSSDHSKNAESHKIDSRSSDPRQRASSASSLEKQKRPLKFKQHYEPPKQPLTHAEPSSSESTDNNDPRLKQKMVEKEDEPAQIPWNLCYDKAKQPVIVTPNVVPRSAFQGVQNAVQDLRKKHPPPQKVRRTPETPEPMDTNQDSCSPGPTTSGSYQNSSSNNLEMLSVVSSVQPRSFPGSKNYDQGASNSETDSNEEVHSRNYQQFPSNYAPPAGKQTLISGPLNSSPSVSPGFNQKSLNLQISSPKQPAIFSKQALGCKKSTYQKVKEDLLINPKQSQSSGKLSKLSEIFPLHPSYNNTYSTARASIHIAKKPIKTELRTPPNDKLTNPPTFAPHLASYLPDMLSRSCSSERPTWNTDHKKTVASPVTPTMSPSVVSRAVSSPVTPSPPLHRESGLQEPVYVTPPIARPVASAKMETPPQSSRACSSKINQIRTPLVLKSPVEDKKNAKNASRHSVAYGTRGRSKSNESFASLGSSSPDVPDTHTQKANENGPFPTVCNSISPLIPNDIQKSPSLINSFPQSTANVIMDTALQAQPSVVTSIDAVMSFNNSNAPLATSTVKPQIDNYDGATVNRNTESLVEINKPVTVIENAATPIAEAGTVLPLAESANNTPTSAGVTAQSGIETAYINSLQIENNNKAILDPPRDPRLARYQASTMGSKPVENFKHQDETVTSSNETSDTASSQVATPAANTGLTSSAKSGSGNCDASVSSTTNISSEDTYSEAQRRKYSHPEPEKLVIFDETLMSRLSKKRRTSSQEEGGEADNTDTTSRIVNPLLRNRAAKLVKKTRLTDTVDAILKSENVIPLPRESFNIAEPVSVPESVSALESLSALDSVSALDVLSEYDDIVGPVMLAVAGVSRIIERSRESSGNSLANMPVLSPISPPSTPPKTSQHSTVIHVPPPLPAESPPPIPIGSPPRAPSPLQGPLPLAVKPPTEVFPPQIIPAPIPSPSPSPPPIQQTNNDLGDDKFTVSRKRRCSRSYYRKQSSDTGNNGIVSKPLICKRDEKTEVAEQKGQALSQDNLKKKREAIKAAVKGEDYRIDTKGESSKSDEKSINVAKILSKPDIKRSKSDEKHPKAEVNNNQVEEKCEKVKEKCEKVKEKCEKAKEKIEKVEEKRPEKQEKRSSKKAKRSSKEKKRSKSKNKEKECKTEKSDSKVDEKPSKSTVFRFSIDGNKAQERRSHSQESNASKASRGSQDCRSFSHHRSSPGSPSGIGNTYDRDSNSTRQSGHRHCSRQEEAEYRRQGVELRHNDKEHEARRFPGESRVVCRRRSDDTQPRESESRRSEGSRSRDRSSRGSYSKSPVLAKNSGRRVTVTQISRSPTITRTLSRSDNQPDTSKHRKSKRRK